VGVARNIAVVAAAAGLVAGCGGAAQRAAPPPKAPAPPVRTMPDIAIAPIARAPVPRGPHNAPVPILMYHVIARPRPGTPDGELWVPWGRFARDMGALARAGYHAVTLDTVYRAWHGRGALPIHPIVISFDDGYASQYQHARATLDRLHWPGVLNLEVHNVGEKGGLSRGQVERLVRDGWEIAAHTLTHPDLTTVDAAQLRREVAGSRRWLQHAFDVPVRFFCYPSGRYDARVEAAVRAAGFAGATTTQSGIASPRDDRFALPRVRVAPEQTPAELVRGLAAG
jgi:peptidoglycan/xylan/chitin deacetylase (PgdA/CDA1 family)